jgi:hypothetical protein
VLFLGLLMMKVVLAISTVLVFVGMPIAIVLSPVISWIPRVLARAFAVCLAVPFVWSLCFAVSGALLNDALFLKGSSGFFAALLEPLAAIALLWMMLLLPTRLAQMAMLGGSVGGGFVSRTVSYAAGSQLRELTRERLPGWTGGHAGGGERRGRESDSRLSTRLRAESVMAASKAAGVAGVTAAAGAATAASGAAAGGAVASSRGHGSGGANGPSSASTNGEHGPGWLGAIRGSRGARAYSPPPLAAREAALAASGGLQRPSWRQEDFDAEMLEASLREQHQPVSAEQARHARDALPAITRAAVASLVADQGPRARQHLAYQALGEWTPPERDAIRTLAAASPEVRAQAFSDSAGSTAGFGEGAEPKAGRTSAAAGGSGPTPASPAGGANPAGNGGTRVRAPQDQPRSTEGGEP